jgi:hypothetical protein
MNMKTVKLSELAGKTFDNIDLVKDSVEKFGLIIALLTEFSSMQQIISREDGVNLSLQTKPEEPSGQVQAMLHRNLSKNTNLMMARMNSSKSRPTSIANSVTNAPSGS